MTEAQKTANFLQKDAKEAQQYFLEHYWQKRPLLVRGAFPGGLPFVDPDTLAGLSCQEGIDSRLIFEKGSERAWQTSQGPFEEDVFATLPQSHWTLLVQAVDRLVPEVSSLREKFSFLPNWRLDDIMISYAVDQGSVGPHTDNYDVFLIQAMGRRKWDYSSEPLRVIEFQEGLDLKILKEFTADQSFVLEEGDMLYLPPHVAHHGVAQGECMTYSVGFRAPTQNEMLVSFAQFLIQSDHPEVFFTDDSQKHGERLRGGPGELSKADRRRLQELMIRGIEDESAFDRWIGAFLTEPRHFHEPLPELIEAPELLTAIQSLPEIFKVEGGRFTYFLKAGKIYFSVEGETLVTPEELLPLVKILCEEDLWDSGSISAYASLPGFEEIMLHLWNQGYLRASQPDDE